MGLIASEESFDGPKGQIPDPRIGKSCLYLRKGRRIENKVGVDGF